MVDLTSVHSLPFLDIWKIEIFNPHAVGYCHAHRPDNKMRIEVKCEISALRYWKAQSWLSSLSPPLPQPLCMKLRATMLEPRVWSRLENWYTTKKTVALTPEQDLQKNLHEWEINIYSIKSLKFCYCSLIYLILMNAKNNTKVRQWHTKPKIYSGQWVVKEQIWGLGWWHSTFQWQNIH